MTAVAAAAAAVVLVMARMARCGRWVASPCGDSLDRAGLGVSLALVHVLQPAQLLQELGPGVVVVTGGARPRPQSFL